MPEPLGIEFKTVACSLTWDLILIEVYSGKKGTNNRNYQKDLGETSSCTKRTTEATKGIGQKYRKWATMGCFILDR